MGFIHIGAWETRLNKDDISKLVIMDNSLHFTIYKETLDQISDCVYMFDPESLYFVYANRGAIDQLGYTHEELLNMRPIDIKPEFDEATFRELISPLVNGQQREIRFETFHRTKNALAIPVYILLQLLAPEGGHARFVAVVRDISESRRLENYLRESRQESWEFAAWNESVRDDERAHIAREIHDELGQYLTVLRMEASLLKIKYGALDSSLAEHLDAMKGHIDRMIAAVRDIANRLRPSVLDHGLIAAVRWLLEAYREPSGLTIRLHVNESQDVNIPPELTTAIFRILQESLTNVVRHAEANRVDITITINAHEISLMVFDDGKGIYPVNGSKKKTFGLLSMRERAKRWGGAVSIDSVPGWGTELNVSFPVIEKSQ